MNFTPSPKQNVFKQNPLSLNNNGRELSTVSEWRTLRAERYKFRKLCFSSRINFSKNLNFPKIVPAIKHPENRTFLRHLYDSCPCIFTLKPLLKVFKTVSLQSDVFVYQHSLIHSLWISMILICETSCKPINL